MHDSALPGTMPETMTAVEIREPGGPEVLVPVSRPVPVPGPGEVLIKVAAAGVPRQEWSLWICIEPFRLLWKSLAQRTGADSRRSVFDTESAPE